MLLKTYGVSELKSLMKVSISICLLLAVLPVFAESPATNTLPSAPWLVREVRSLFFDRPVFATGKLQSRNLPGEVEAEYPVEMALLWSSQQPHAVFSVSDPFGAPLTSFELSHSVTGGLVSVRMKHHYDREQQQPLFEEIGQTDVTPYDLSLPFLWWDNGQTRGLDKVKGRECYVVDLQAPPNPLYTGARLWLDTETGAMMQAYLFDHDAALTKKFRVKSLKKVDGQWMLKDFEIKKYPEKTKTRLFIDELEFTDDE